MSKRWLKKERKEYKRDWKRRAYAKDSEKYLKQNREWRQKDNAKNPEKYHEAYLKRRKLNPKSSSCHHQALRHVELAKFCELCPEDDMREATIRHHPDYDYPEIIVSVCGKCHSRV